MTYAEMYNKSAEKYIGFEIEDTKETIFCKVLQTIC